MANFNRGIFSEKLKLENSNIMEQRISRRDVFQSDDDRTDASCALTGLELEFVEIADANTAEESVENEPMVFNLFGNTQEIDLKDEPEEMIRQVRPESYYFDRPDDEERSKFKQVAVSGREILNNSQKPYFGMKMSWRVINYTELARKQKLENRKDRKKRPGRKSRLARREKKDQRQRERKQTSLSRTAFKTSHDKFKRVTTRY